MLLTIVSLSDCCVLTQNCLQRGQALRLKKFFLNLVIVACWSANQNAHCNVESCRRPDCDNDDDDGDLCFVCIFALKRKENCRLCFQKDVLSSAAGWLPALHRTLRSQTSHGKNKLSVEGFEWWHIWCSTYFKWAAIWWISVWFVWMNLRKFVWFHIVRFIFCTNAFDIDQTGWNIPRTRNENQVRDQPKPIA